MKEKYELIPLGDASHLIRKYKKHWWSSWKIEMDGNTPKIYPVDQKNCKHRLVFLTIGQSFPRFVPVPIYRCVKCGYEQIGKEHIKGNCYE